VIRDILIWPHPKLEQTAFPVQEVTDETRVILDDMIETFEVLQLVNPKIVERRYGVQRTVEGCLSLPQTWLEVDRDTWVRVEALDETGTKIEIEGDGLLAVALQHEIDHLDGKVIADSLPPMKRLNLKDTFRKAKRLGLRYRNDPGQPIVRQ
jgi:peptide deformylase